MNRLTIRSLYAAGAAMFAVPAVLAQEPTPAGATAEGTLEEVTVTARRREESLQDVPIAVTALTAADLALHGTTNIGELTESVPSVTLEPTRATSSTLSAFIRGVGQQDPLAGFEQGVALYVDDVYIARPQGSLLDIYDIERVEVLRGPQGTLYGRNAVGGAIKYVTRPLSDEADFSVQANYGSYNQIDLIGTGSLPLGDTFRVGAAVASLTRDGYGDNRTTGDEHYDKDVFAYRLSAEFEPNDAWLVRVSYDHTDDKSNAVAGYRPFPGAVSGAAVLDDLRDTEAGATGLPSTAGIGGNNELEAEGAQATITWELNDSVTLRSITAYREDYTESVIDFDSLEVMDFDGGVIYDNEQFSQELQLLYGGERWNAVAGLYYLDATASNDFDIVLAQLIPGVPLTSFTGGTIDTEAWSLFADVTYDLTDRWALSVGARYTEDKRTADVFRANYIGIGSPFFGNTAAPLFNVTSDYEAERTYDDVSPRVNVSYSLSDDVILYAGYSQGFKAGSFDPRGANLVTPEVEEGFDPETLDSYEAGVKATWLGGRARTNVAVFYSDYQDMQIPGSLAIDTDGDGINDDFVGAVTNAGQAVIQGIEVEGDFLLTERLSMQLALSLLDPEIEEWIVEGEDVSGEREIQNTPDTMAYLGLTHRTDFDAGTLSLNVNGSYKSDIVQFEVPVPVIDQDSYTLLNASVVWAAGGGHWSLGLHGKNLTDEDVKTAGYCFGSGGCPSTLGVEDNTTVFYGPPRTVTATFEYRF
jgi:iron complex outermembrane receptor protein